MDASSSTSVPICHRDNQSRRPKNVILTLKNSMRLDWLQNQSYCEYLCFNTTLKRLKNKEGSMTNKVNLFSVSLRFLQSAKPAVKKLNLR